MQYHNILISLERISNVCILLLYLTWRSLTTAEGPYQQVTRYGNEPVGGRWRGVGSASVGDCLSLRIRHSPFLRASIRRPVVGVVAC